MPQSLPITPAMLRLIRCLCGEPLPAPEAGAAARCPRCRRKLVVKAQNVVLATLPEEDDGGRAARDRASTAILLAAVVVGCAGLFWRRTLLANAVIDGLIVWLALTGLRRALRLVQRRGSTTLVAQRRLAAVVGSIAALSWMLLAPAAGALAPTHAGIDWGLFVSGGLLFYALGWLSVAIVCWVRQAARDDGS